MKNINEKTNSYYTEDEKQYLEDNGFSWSNESNKSYEGHDNCLYSHTNGIDYDIEVTSKEFIIHKTVTGLIDNNRTRVTFDSFLEVTSFLEQGLTLSQNIEFSMLKLLTRMVLVFFQIFHIIAFPINFYLFSKINYIDNDFNSKNFFGKIKMVLDKSVFKFNPFQKIPFFLYNEVRIYIFILLAIATTILSTYLIMK
jgi:hypothetical protein